MADTPAAFHFLMDLYHSGNDIGCPPKEFKTTFQNLTIEALGKWQPTLKLTGQRSMCSNLYVLYHS